MLVGLPGDSDGKQSACNAGDQGLVPGERNGNPVPYSCLETPKDGGTWRATVHRVAESQTQLSDYTHRWWYQIRVRAPQVVGVSSRGVRALLSFSFSG